MNDQNPQTTRDEGVILASAHSGVPCRQAAKRWILAATILASSMAFIDGTVVNVALGALTQARVRHRTLRELRRQSEDHRRHRGSPGDCENPLSFGCAYSRAAAFPGTASRSVPSGLIYITVCSPKISSTSGLLFRSSIASRRYRCRIGADPFVQPVLNVRENVFLSKIVEQIVIVALVKL